MFLNQVTSILNGVLRVSSSDALNVNVELVSLLNSYILRES